MNQNCTKYKFSYFIFKYVHLIAQNYFDVSPANLGSQVPLCNMLSNSDTLRQSVDE